MNANLNTSYLSESLKKPVRFPDQLSSYEEEDSDDDDDDVPTDKEYQAISVVEQQPSINLVRTWEHDH